MPCLFLKFWPGVHHFCFKQKWWVCEACHRADSGGQDFIALGCRSRMLISSKKLEPRVVQAEWSCQQKGKLLPFFAGGKKKGYLRRWCPSCHNVLHYLALMYDGKSMSELSVSKASLYWRHSHLYLFKFNFYYNSFHVFHLKYTKILYTSHFPFCTTVYQRVVFYTYVFTSSVTMPVARTALDRDTGWFPKSSFPQLKPLYRACFHRSAPQALLWGFCASVVCLSEPLRPPHDNTAANAVQGSKITPRLTNSETLGPSETSGSGWVQLLVHAHTPETIGTQARCGHHLT